MSWEEKWSEEAQRDYWHMPNPGVLALIKDWKAKGFKDVADIGCGVGRHAIALLWECVCS